MCNVTVEIVSEEVLIDEPARVRIFEDGLIVEEVIAKIEFKQGADGRYYDCVVLEKSKER